MSSILKGKDFSMWLTSGICIGISEKENRDGVKSKYAIFTVYDEDGGDPTKVFKFEDQLFPGAVELLAKYKLLDDQSRGVKDARGRTVINMKALKSSEDAEQFSRFMVWPGGLIEDYKLKKGPCYANDMDGKPVLDRNKARVIKSTIKIFTQVKMYIVDENGKMSPKYLNGMGLEENGDRMERTFYTEAVNPATRPSTNETSTDKKSETDAKSEEDPF
jgi:hypothetical protein